jgi:hypothetical protein
LYKAQPNDGEALVEPYYSSVVTLGPMDGGGAAPPDAAATFPGVVVRRGEISKLPRLAPPFLPIYSCVLSISWIN